MGLKFDPNVPPGITVPEWYLTGLYAFLRSGYDKFTTGVAWPGLFILTLLIMPFIDRYKKFSWKDRPIIAALGITSIAQIMVTTYWGFYIDPDRTKSLLERLVIDPIFLYTVMVLLVPLSFGFTYLMIKLAKNAEERSKAQKKPAEKSAIQLPEKWLYIIFVCLIGFQVYLNIATYYALLSGMKNFSLFLVGIIMLVFAGMFHLYRHGKSLPKSNIEVVSSKRPSYGLSSFGNKILGKDTSKKPLPIGASTGATATVSSLPSDDLGEKTKEEKPVAAESPEIKTPSKTSTSTSSSSSTTPSKTSTSTSSSSSTTP
jgi:ubiquinol-cytochrome c reductase cytochrome b subunit